jgi:3D-(3,5/4)-trihydroxycyclohexane-1,2-dione acylhydrolase (decyclizing)
LEQAAAEIRASRRPLIVAGGGVIYSEAGGLLQHFVEQIGIPVGETMAGKGSLRYDHPFNLGAIGATGTFAANRIARDADLIIGIGTRYSDFTTSSKTAFQNLEVRFVNINVTEVDAAKHHALSLVGDAKATLEELLVLLDGHRVDESYRSQAGQLHTTWEAEVERIYAIRHTPLPSQGELIGAVNEHSDPGAIMVCAAGSLPGDLHKLWRARHPKNYHMEYGYSCMGYEIAGGLGAKMAAPDRDVYVMVGDGSYLMMNSEIVTSIQENYKLIIVLLDNHGFKSIGSLSRSLGQEGFGTRYAYPHNGVLPGDEMGADIQTLSIDLAANARSLGAYVIECRTYADFVAALENVRTTGRTSVIYIQNDRYESVPGYESWWDVPVAEVSTSPQVQAARTEWETNQSNERYFL